MYYFRRMCFPGGRKKALTVSYDDDTKYNIQLVEILNRYGIKGTFNLNFGRFPAPGNESGFMTLAEAKKLFEGTEHEVAIHGYTHMPLGKVPKNVATQDVVMDLMEGEKAFGRIIRGMAYAEGSFNGESGAVLEQCGIAYCRTVCNTRSFKMPEDWLYLHPTCHHEDEQLFELAENFLVGDPLTEAWMFYLWGHAYEFNNNKNWDRIEKFCDMMSGRDDIWYATNIEICDYVRDYNRLIFSFDGSRVYNPTCTEIFFAVGYYHVPYEFSVKPGETVIIDRSLPNLTR